MYLVLMNYVKPTEVIDELLPEHRKFLEANYQAGLFLLSGPREPRNGGVILAQAGSRWELAAVLEQDPFVTQGAATYEIIEFKTTRTGKALRFLLDGEC
ncbi:MAG TPA: YciI family protein [Humidesulfovibrio sp.]|uniref:YciI family protein n=1 Tax=Humidesulfovibrio sp. TaxID=2910988 RepID=UPI002B6BD54E|nr:YciI family protein [Humidesulfovibrio sp.]HWR03976.1 YciI family protein [Humidesulfovibrio sp.]